MTAGNVKGPEELLTEVARRIEEKRRALRAGFDRESAMRYEITQLRHRAESAEAEREDLRAEVDRLRTLAHRVTRPDEVELRDGTLGQKARSAVGRFQERLKRNGHYTDENRPTGSCDCGCGVTG